jgi:hypothetical protein
MAVTHIKKVEIWSFIQARIRIRQIDPNPTGSGILVVTGTNCPGNALSRGPFRCKITGRKIFWPFH